MEHNHLISATTLVGLIFLVLMLIFTSPTDIGPLGVLLFFTTVYAVAFGLITKLMQLFLRLAYKRKNFRPKDYLYSAILAFAPIMFLMARSFGAINFLTCFLIIAFVSLTEFLAVKFN